jgi:hypothetical protein
VNVVRSSTNTINGATSATIGSQYSSTIFVADFETNQWFAASSGLGATNIAVDAFSGNGSTTAFTLSGDPGSENNTQVYVSGVYQEKDTYSVSGTTLTFSTAPPTGTSNIEVVSSAPLAIGTPSDGTVTTAKLASTTGSGAVVLATSPTITTPVISSLSSASATALTLQSAGTTAITVDTSQNVGIGTTSPNDVLTVGGTAAFIRIDRTADEPGIDMRVSGSNTNKGVIAVTTGGSMYFTSGGNTERMRIDSSGNVLIATTNAITGITGAQLTASNTSENPAYINIFRDDTTIGNGQFLGYLQFCGRDATSSLGTAHAYVGAVAEADHGAGDNATAITFGTTPDNSSSMAQRMRIPSDGGIRIAMQDYASAPSSTNYGVSINNTSAGSRFFGQGSGTETQIEFGNTNGTRGSIQTNSTNTLYNTTSDYRLKENVVPMANALATVLALKPCTYKWKVDGSNGQGFIAHELQAVVPDCVTGEKDAVDENGDIKPQFVDTSFLVATLTAAIQELKAINDTQAETINALTARITALENN